MTPGVAAGVVAAHTAVNLAHGVPHLAAPVSLARWQWAFVVGVVVAAPVISVGLVWRGRRGGGGALLAVSLAASLAFGVYFHFAVPNPDHVHAVTGPWSGSFTATAWLSAAIDAAGVAVAAWLVVGEGGTV